MMTMTVTAKSQVTLRKDLLRHLGNEPGQKIEAIDRPGGESKFGSRGRSGAGWWTASTPTSCPRWGRG